MSGNAFTALTPEYAFAATGSSGTAVQILPTSTNGPTGFCQYRIVVSATAGSAATVTVVLATSATAAVIPVGGTPQPFTRTMIANSIEVLSGPPQAFLNAITSTGNMTLYVSGGEGV